MDKKPILTGFNKQLEEFLDDIVRLFPNDKDIRTARTSMNLMKKMNPKLIINCWYEYVSKPYGHEIVEKGIDPFIDKNYKEDMKYLEESAKILEVIDRIRAPLRNLNENDKKISSQYIVNLVKLSNAYNL